MAYKNYGKHNPRLMTGVIGEYCQVGKSTVLEWIHRGWLKAFRLPSGHYRVDREDFREFLEQYGMPVEEWLFESGSGRETR